MEQRFVNVVNTSDNPLPTYETSRASGMDVRASEVTEIRPRSTAIIKTGLFVEIPPGLELQVRPRSGLSAKTKLRVANAPGTIDSCYRGEIGVIIDNTGEDEIKIAKGDRIAQLVLVPVLRCMWRQLDDKSQLGETDRGAGGFGSTGTK